MINIKRVLVLTILFSTYFSLSAVAQKINQFDANGKRTGVWKKYYENGKIRYSGKFLNGKEVGVFKFYKKRSQFPEIVKEFSTTSDTAQVKFYTNLGKLKTKGAMIGKNRVGLWTYLYSNGRVFSTESYNNGKLEGLLKNYYPNGKLTNETTYKNGLKNGLSKTYTDEGVLIEEVNYVDGKLHGLAKFYDLKGGIKEKGMYEHNARKGKWEYYIDGEISDKPRREKYRKE